MSMPNNPQKSNPQQNPQTSYGYNYYYPSYYSYPHYSYSHYYPYAYPAYPSPKYYYEITKYTSPFAPPGKRDKSGLNLVWILLTVLAVVNIVSGGALLFAAYDELHENTVILTGNIIDSNTVEPLADVKITVSGVGVTVYSTNGNFEIPLTTGVHCLVFEKPGYNTINGTVMVGKYLHNHITVEMKKGNENLNQTLTSFKTTDDYIANLMVSSTLSVFIGGFALISAMYIRKVLYRSLGIVSGVLGVFSLFVLSGIALIFMIPAAISTVIGFVVIGLMYPSSEIFLSQPESTTGTN